MVKLNNKTKSCKGKKHDYQHKYWWVVCVYLFVPIIFILLFGKVFTSLLQDFMAGARIGEIIVSNSTYAVNKVIHPFIESLMIIIGVIISYLILRFLQKKLFERKIYFVGVKKCLKYFEVTTVLLAVIIAIYGKVNSFDFSQYGYSVDTIKEAIYQKEAKNIPLEIIPSMHSIGISIREGNLLYNMLLHMSHFLFYLSDNLEMVIAIAGTVIIPLKNYSEEFEGKK